MDDLKPEEVLTEEEQALAMIKEAYDDGEAIINDHAYKFTKMFFGERRAVFAYLSTIEPKLSKHDLSFIDDAKFKQIETLMFKHITYDGMTLSKKNVFEIDEAFICDYMLLITTALQVISFPFSKGSSGM